MKITFYSSIARLFQYFFLAALMAGFSVHAKIVDDFSTTNLVSWTSTLNGGTIQQTNPAAVGQFTVTPTNIAGRFTWSRKTAINAIAAAASFTNVPTHTLEFKVLVNSIFVDGTTTNGQAVIGWVPSLAGALRANGYSLSVGPMSATIRANTSVLYHTNFDTALPSSSLAIVMRMTTVTNGGTTNIIVKSTVYSQSTGLGTVLFEHSDTNSPRITGIRSGGNNVALGALNDDSGAATQVRFDDVQVFDTLRTVLDNFSGPYPGANWVNRLTGDSANAIDGSGHLQMTGNSGVIGSSGARYNSETFKISDGTRLEMRLDIVTNITVSDNAVFLGYAPNGDSDFAGLTMYHMIESPAGVLVGKAISGWWSQEALTPPAENLRLIQTFTGEGADVRIETRIEDLSVDVNDPARLVYQFMYVDTSTAGFINKNGYFAMGVYHTGAAPDPDTVVVDNAEVNKTLANNPPNFASVTPPNGTNFYNPAGGISIRMTDDVTVNAGSIQLTLNGVVYTTNSPGVTLSGPANNRTFTFTNLALNTYYDGTIAAADNVGESNVVHYQFDTFSQTNLTIEIEDFNYDSGQFHDNGVNAYEAHDYVADVDYHNTNTGQEDPPAPPDAYRVFADHQGFEMWPLEDNNPRRTKYVSEPVNGYKVYSAGNNGDWMNFTRTFPAGTYKVYLRLSTAGIAASVNALGYVGGDRTTTTQTVTNIGTFKQLGDAAGDTGVNIDRTVPLVDGLGNPVIIRFTAGVQTLRLTRQNGDDGIVLINYMVLVTTPDPGVLRPIVAFTSPTAGSTTRQSPDSEGTYASIVNQETSVTNIVALKQNGVNVAFTTTNTANGKDVGWSFAATPGTATITNTLVYQDNMVTNNTFITNTWTYGYPLLRAANRLAGALSTRGFSVRMVQSDVDPGGNTFAVAEGQLALPNPTAGEATRTWQTNVQTLNWDDNAGTTPSAHNASYGTTRTPGLDGGPSGYAEGPYDNIAVEILGYLYLTAGPHRLAVHSDDSFQIRSGTNLTDRTAIAVLAFNEDGSFHDNRSFDINVEATGLYPMRGIWQEGGGYADFFLFSRNPDTGVDTYINDPAGNPVDVVKAFYPDVPTPGLESAANVNGPYLLRTDASVNTGTKTVTVPILTDAKQFFRLNWTSAITITNVTKVGTNIVIKYP